MNKLFLSKAERDYLRGKDQTSHDYVCVKSRLNKMLKVFVDQELPLLLERRYLSDIAEFRNIADFLNTSNSPVAEPGRARLSLENTNDFVKKALGGIWTHDLRSSPPVFTKTRAEDYETFALPG